MFSDFFQQKIKQARQYNITQVREEIDCFWVQEKINNWMDRWSDLGYAYSDIETAILENDIVASFFAKDPMKQNLGEKAISEYLNIKKMPSAGKNCVRFDRNGDIVFKKINGASKSADFFINGVYITQKYTGENTGGAQDNQYQDVVEFLFNGSKQHKVGALVDGKYWEDMGHKNRLKEEFKENSNVFIFSADEYKELGEKIFE